MEPRTVSDIMADLLQMVIDGQWSGEIRQGCHCHPEYLACCPECEVLEYDKHADTMEREHKPDCKRMALIREVQAFLRVESALAEVAEEWKYFEPLFKWRDEATDRWGDDLVCLLAGLGGFPRDNHLTPELKEMWDDFGRLDEDTRWDYADAYTRATGWDGTSYYSE